MPNQSSPSGSGPGPTREVAAAHGGRQMRKLALSSEAGREYFEKLCRDVRRVVLKPLRDGNSVEYPTSMVGRLDGASLLIDWPSDRDGLTPLRVGERIEVKFFSERDLVIFQVDVTLCCFRPRPYLHLGWPKEIAYVEVRQVARVPMAKAAVFIRPAVDAGVAEQVRGRVVDLSLGGAAFISERGDLPVGEQGELMLSIHPEADRTAVYVRPKCALRSRREGQAGKGEFQYGVQFIEPSINDRLVLLAIVGEAALSRQD